jgi:pyruvate formate-lyase/glycerol dehydratase family glycyl radical enzyme
MVDRVQRLLTAHRTLLHTQYREVKDLSVLDDGDGVREPLVVRKAKALALLLDETASVILEDELIVGLRTVYGPLRAGENVFGGFDYELPVKPATAHRLTYFPHYLADEEGAAAQREGVREGAVSSHVPFGCSRVLRLGYGGLVAETLQSMKALQGSSPRSRKLAFLQAAEIVLQAASRFALRHAQAADRLASTTGDLRRRGELQTIADGCRWIAIHPPRSFQEALQLFWFTCLVHKAENQACLPIGRFDQDLYPFYRQDVAEGGLTGAAALELLQCLWIKLNMESDLTTDTCENVTLAGQDAQGHDVTNALTYLCLDATERLRLPDPKINVRFHAGSPPALWTRCCELVKVGMGGVPCFYNDDALIAGLVRAGIPLEDARLYCSDGCQEVIIPGKGDFYTTFTGINFLTDLLHVLHTPREAASFPAFLTAYKAAVAASVKRAVAEGNRRDAALARYSPVPFLSATLEGCLASATDKTAGGTIYNLTGCLGQAFVNAVNSLAVIKQLVYEDAVLSLTDLRDCLAKNWAGCERLRQLAVNRVPKYGNDDDYVDALAVEIAEHFVREALTYSNPRGGRYYPGIFTFHQVAKGKAIEASPDGRRAGTPVTNHLSPAVGTDLHGPTAAINSAAKVCRVQPPEGAALGIRFHPTALQGAEGTTNLLSFIQTFMADGGLEVQFNVVDADTLRKAQRTPEAYRDLIVRVWGFSAYFVTLTEDYQEDIIARTAHGL